MRILPDYHLLTGIKIPPVTPNIIDVRILRLQVTAEFPPGVSKGRRLTNLRSKIVTAATLIGLVCLALKVLSQQRIFYEGAAPGYFAKRHSDWCIQRI